MILVVAFRGCYMGFSRGGLIELLHLAGLVAATVAASSVSGRIVNWIMPWWRGAPQVLDVCGFGVLWLTVAFVAHLTVSRLAALLTRERFHWMTQGVGMIVGSVRGLWWAGLILLFMLSWNQPYLASSITKRSLMGASLVKRSQASLRWMTDRVFGHTARGGQSLLLKTW